jgi:hypothetical protein
MPTGSLADQLQAFREKAREDQNTLNKMSQEPALDRMRREIQDQLEKSEKYRASILQNVNTFCKRSYKRLSYHKYNLYFLSLAGLSIEAIYGAARSMEEVFYKKGDFIIQQDDIGDSFFVLEDGLVSVSVSFCFTSGMICFLLNFLLWLNSEKLMRMIQTSHLKNLLDLERTLISEKFHF